MYKYVIRYKTYVLYSLHLSNKCIQHIPKVESNWIIHYLQKNMGEIISSTCLQRMKLGSPKECQHATPKLHKLTYPYSCRVVHIHDGKNRDFL